ncbi:sterol desaturase family protein [Phenylobacterium sp.]|uniref:sterol desaturase family protein n=1 Tax=Phenylobacterium sp. TaxID=1871053 RepID=UPI002F419D4F
MTWGLLLAAVCLEALVDWRFRRRLYEWRDTERSLGLAAGWAVGSVADGLLAMAAINFAYGHRLLDLGAGPWAPVLAILLADAMYYAWHRLSHHAPWLWASHFPHHTAKRINMLSSVRQGWTDVLSGSWLTWIGLGFLGFTPLQAAPYFTLLFLVQLAAHNEWTPRLGPLEWLFVTPSNHRVHHSLAAHHVNRNYGGVLVIWDRLFGSYASEGPAILHSFGLEGFDADTASPVQIAFHEWRRMLPRREPAA